MHPAVDTLPGACHELIMQHTLKKQYLFMLVPAICLFLAAGLAKQSAIIQPGRFAVPGVVHSVVFILAALFALAGPILIRTLFANAAKGKTRVQAELFLSFQKKILWVSMISPYLAFMAYLCDFPQFHAGAVLLMAMYSAYYYFPSEKRISFDQKIFRVK